MKKLVLVLTVILWAFAASAQDTIVKWTFPSTSADSLADGGLTINAARYISAQYGTWATASYRAILLDYTTNGSLGAPDKCAKATGWNDGADSSCWIVKFKTTGYGSLKLYSKQQSGGSFPGPKDWKVQYKLPGNTSPWIDLPGGTVTCANDWTTGAVNGLDLPATCNNLSGNVAIRWVLTSNLDINGATLLATGINKIDDIIVTGTSTAGIEELSCQALNFFPNPNNSRSLTIVSPLEIKLLSIYNLQGQLVQAVQEIGFNKVISLETLKTGLYIVRAEYVNGSASAPSKLIVE